MTEKRRMRWTIWVAFAVLCLLVSSSWLLPVDLDDGLSSIKKQSCFYAVIGFVAFVAAYRRICDRVRNRDAVLLRLAGASVLLLGFPSVVSGWARTQIPALSQTALFALVPFVVVVVAMGRDPIWGEEPGVRRFFVPALAGFSGALFLLSFNFPVSTRGRLMFGVVLTAVVAVGFASTWFYRLLRGFGMVEAFAVVSLSNAAFLAVCSIVSSGSWSGPWPLVSISSLRYLLELILLVWLLREMSPVRLAARYLVVPLLAVLEGLVILRPAFTVRMGAGLLLLICGTGYILFSRSRDPDSALSIR